MIEPEGVQREALTSAVITIYTLFNPSLYRSVAVLSVGEIIVSNSSLSQYIQYWHWTRAISLFLFAREPDDVPTLQASSSHIRLGSDKSSVPYRMGIYIASTTTAVVLQRVIAFHKWSVIAIAKQNRWQRSHDQYPCDNNNFANFMEIPFGQNGDYHDLCLLIKWSVASQPNDDPLLLFVGRYPLSPSHFFCPSV